MAETSFLSLALLLCGLASAAIVMKAVVDLRHPVKQPSDDSDP